MKYLFDEHFSKHLIELMKKCQAPGSLIHVIPSGFGGMADLDFLPKLAELGFVLVTADRNDKTRGLSVEDLKSLHLSVLFLGGFWNHLDNWSATEWLVSSWRSLCEKTSEWSPGTCGLVAKSGDIRLL